MGHMISPYSSTRPDDLLELTANVADVDMPELDTRIDDTPLHNKLQWSMSLDEPGEAKVTIDSFRIVRSTGLDWVKPSTFGETESSMQENLVMSA